MFSRVLLTLFATGSLGGLMASWLAPKGIAWYFEPPVEIGINCRPATEWAMHQLQRAQMFGVMGGVLIGAVVIYFSRKKKDNKGFSSTLNS